MADFRSASDENNDQAFSIDPSAPFRGVVVCCTSIPPEQRTDIANKVAELGGVHKYDLTPDVTHLVVGDYDTPKYRHVARERMDIRAMDALWIEAISEIWRNDETIDFLALEKEHQLRPLEKCGVGVSAEGQATVRDSLLICLTGFGEQRDEIAEMITSNGGNYTGDLTRKCSHLVVKKPEGKKFSAAKSWGVHAVTLEWLQQSVQRGMILEEAKFDPILPADEQGVGAWIKTDPRRASLGKRSRSAILQGAEDGPRKLRKTASMKLNSQRNNLWGDILGRSTSREYSFAEDNQEADSERDSKPEPRPRPQQAAAPEKRGIFSNCAFFVHGFTEQRQSILEQTIISLDGQVVSSLDQLPPPDDPFTHFLIVPQLSQPDTHPSLPSSRVHIITEFYVEKCLHNRQFFDPSDQVLGRPFPLFPIRGFSKLRISSAAFTGIELSQVSRSIGQLGATFDEFFTKATSLVVCKSLTAMRKEKLKLAVEWGVPVVSADWLWECISTGYRVPTENFVYPELQKMIKAAKSRSSSETGSDAPTQKLPRSSHLSNRPQQQPKPSSRPPAAAGVDTTAFDNDAPASPPKRRTTKRDATTVRKDSTTSADFVTARTHPGESFLVRGDTTTTNISTTDAPLSELSSASLNKSPSPTKQVPEKLMSRTKSEPVARHVSAAEPLTEGEDERHASAPPPAEASEKGNEEAAARRAAERQAMSSKLTSLLASAASASPDIPDSHHSEPRARRRILGRATSNVSNASSGAAAPVRPTTSLEDYEILGAGLGFVDGGEDRDGDGEDAPPTTQLEYFDPEAQGHKAAVMNQMMGLNAGEGAAAKGTVAAAGGTSRSRSTRRR